MAGNDNYMQDYINAMIANNIQQHGIPANGNRYRIVPMRVGDINDGHGSTGALYLIGFWNGEPIYRTTHTAAHCKKNIYSHAMSMKIIFLCRHGRQSAWPI